MSQSALKALALVSSPDNAFVLLCGLLRGHPLSFLFVWYACLLVLSVFRLALKSIVLPGSVRTATKRAGGSIRNHGGSPGKRLGVKKFSGA